jgi:isocitrate dehydrogenase
VASQPERFDVIVTSNLYGDILSDVAAQIAGSVGLAGSANVGNHVAMFEAIHGSAPDIAGKNIANPSGLINGAIQMLIHINQPEVASTIENAWLRTLEDGIHTGDIYTETHSRQKVGTEQFADAVIDRLGKKPEKFKPVDYKQGRTRIECYSEPKKILSHKELVGVDIFIDNPHTSPEELGKTLSALNGNLKLVVISSRGLKIWPHCMIDAPYIHHCSCRFQSSDDIKNLTPISHKDIIQLLEKFDSLNIDVIKTENLYTFDGKVGFSLAQGQ